MAGQLQGKTALVLGGANGVGSACVAMFAAEGARVVFGDTDERAGIELQQKLSDAGFDVRFQLCNAASIAEIQSFVTEGCPDGAADVGLYAAGIIKPVGFLDLDEASFDQVMSINLKGAVFFFQSLAKALVADGKSGSLISISSIGGVVATERTHVYGTSKAGLIHLAKSLAVSFAAHGIRANTVGPGGVNTRMQQALSVEDRRASLSRTPMLRLAEPEEIASVATFLASDASSYITGQTIYADGGRLALHRTVAVPEEALNRIEGPKNDRQI
jgi:NAD(P)-dependent dehydrogenase (short-subunit alcohol dehydrogenase family)